MRTIPLSVLASWPKPNYVNPETRGPAAEIVGIILVSLVTIIIVLRLYTRQFISKGFGLDDILIFVSYVPATAYAIVGLIGETYLQWKRHLWDVNPALFVPSLQTSLVELVLFDLSTSATKLSMLAMIHRLTSSSEDRKMNILVRVLAVGISVNAFVFFIVTVFQCRPISAYWTVSSDPKNCINEAAHLLAAGIINTLTDFIIVLLPMHTVMNLDLPKKQKTIVIGLFGAGFLATAAGVVRTYFTWLMTTADDFDTTWNSWAASLASEIELYLGIICASIPAIKPFFATYLPKVIDTSLRSRKYSIYSNDPKTPDLMQASSSFQTFIYGPSTPYRPLQYPKAIFPLKKSASTDTNRLNHRPTPTHKRSASADLNKPLPAIRENQGQQSYPPSPTSRTLSLEDQSIRSSGPGSTRPLQRNAMRFTNSSTGSLSRESAAIEDRTTVFIMLQGDESERYGQAV
ncbi:integral membrane protein [Xylariales sp. AK1849]|nr:integral membrane protein [Xylariales sp. AK1849]